MIYQLCFLLIHIVEFLKRQRHAYDTRRIILILHLNFCLSHPRITKGISENSLDVHIESIFRMSWSLLLLVPSPCRICHLLIRGDMCGFSFPLFSPLAAALGFSLAPRRLGKRRTENLFRKHCFLCVLPISCNPNPDGYLEKSFRVGN